MLVSHLPLRAFSVSMGRWPSPEGRTRRQKRRQESRWWYSTAAVSESCWEGQKASKNLFVCLFVSSQRVRTCRMAFAGGDVDHQKHHVATSIEMKAAKTLQDL